MEQEGGSRLGAVFYVSLFISVAFVLWGVLFTGGLSGATASVLGFVTVNFGWLYLVATTLFLVFVVFLAASRYGKVRLGRDEDRPEFGRVS